MTMPLTLSSASAGSSVGAIRLKARETISAVARARASGLVSNTSGRRVIRASPRAATRKAALPGAVSGRSSSPTPGVPLGIAAAWRRSRSLMARFLLALGPLPDSLLDEQFEPGGAGPGHVRAGLVLPGHLVPATLLDEF